MATREQGEDSFIGTLVSDLSAERSQLLNLIAQATREEWNSRTPSPGWTVLDQVAHLAFFDEVGALSVGDPPGFALERERAVAQADSYDADHLRRVPRDVPALLEYWEAAADRLRAVALAAPAGGRVPWYGLDMSLASMVSARIMEHWAHGHDVASSLGAEWNPTDRLSHVAHLAFRARPYGYLVRGLPAPQIPVRVLLDAPSGETWEYGPEDAEERIAGSAEDFCLVLVRRRHVDDTTLVVTGNVAREWLEIGQAYAGPPGQGPARSHDLPTKSVKRLRIPHPDGASMSQLSVTNRRHPLTSREEASGC